MSKLVEKVKKLVSKKTAPKKVVEKKCEACNGTGLLDPHNLCAMCDGSGKVS